MAQPIMRPASDDVARLRPNGGQGSRPMLSFRSRALLTFLALLFTAATITYSISWMYYYRLRSFVELGIDTQVVQNGKAEVIASVWPNSPAEAAGLKAGDEIAAVNGRSLDTHGPDVVLTAWAHGRPGETVVLTIRRRDQVFDVRATFRRTKDAPSGIRLVAAQITGSYPVLFLAVGLSVLFLRLDDPHAWRLAVLFACLVAVTDAPDAYGLAPAGLRSFLLAYRSVFLGLTGPVFLFLFSLFPVRSPFDRKLPWIKWAATAVGLTLGCFGMRNGDLRWPPLLAHALGARAGQNLILAFEYGTICLGFAALGWNFFNAESTQAKRKIRVLFWGTVVGLTPAVLANAAANVFGYRVPFWEDMADIALLSLLPLSFAYAVVKHQVLEIPALLRRSARYVLVRRGFAVLLLLLAISVNVLLGVALSQMFKMHPGLAMSIGGGFGIALAWVAAPAVRRGTQRIDKAFFREAYDAHLILQELAHSVRNINERKELAQLVQDKLAMALHPQAVSVYLRDHDAMLVAPKEILTVSTISPSSPGMRELARTAEPADSSSHGDLSLLLPEVAWLRPECLVPVLGRSGEWLGLIVLGAKLSEEPYSREDKQLLGSVASQAALALESVTLAEQMAQRMEADRRVQQEMQIARAVQSKLLPQQSPPLATLDYAGTCIQARAVGGDYYDFLDLGGGRVGFVLADIAGKGISGALLMANLQASLRSMYAVADRDLPQFLSSVNRLFVKNTETSHYATMFFGVYDDHTRKLLYANCGHNPPLVSRAAGGIDRLTATATVLGLFETWECSVVETELNSGDVLAIYTDGVTEAANSVEEEFGEERLLSLVRANRNLSADALLQEIVRLVQEFSPGEQGDDITLIVAIGR
ncbi:MAG: SpoIIE family protein phosphatase [Actinomycetota bacterium]